MFLKKYSASEKQARIDLRNNTQNNLISNSDDGIRLLELFKKKKDEIAKINKQIKQAEKAENKSEVEILKNRKQPLLKSMMNKLSLPKKIFQMHI